MPASTSVLTVVLFSLSLKSFSIIIKDYPLSVNRISLLFSPYNPYIMQNKVTAAYFNDKMELLITEGRLIYEYPEKICARSHFFNHF